MSIGQEDFVLRVLHIPTGKRSRPQKAATFACETKIKRTHLFQPVTILMVNNLRLTSQ
jgi:hypothetical protein